MAGEIVNKEDYIKYLRELSAQEKQNAATPSTAANMMTSYLTNKKIGDTFESYLKNSLQNNAGTPATTPQMTDTANPVPTVQTVQQEQRSLLDEQKNMANAAANTSYQRMLKYLPQLNKERGYAGLGISEATKAEAWNDLQARLAQIAMNYSMVDDSTKQNALSYVESALQSATTPQEYQDILNLYRKYIPDSDASLLETIGQSPEQQAIFQQYADMAAGYNGSGGATFDSNGQNKGLKAGDNFRIRGSDGTIYYIESGGEVSDEQVLKYAARQKDGDVFKYGNSLYMVKDGTVYLVQRRKNTAAKSYQALLNLYSDNF